MNSRLKDAREGAEAGSLFHNSIVCGKRLCLKLSVDVQYCIHVMKKNVMA